MKHSQALERTVMRAPLMLLLFASIASSLGCSPARSRQFTLRSADIQAGGDIPRRFEFSGFGCKGENRPPELHWLDAPPGTKSFAVTVFDRDAPTGSGWWHWIVVNIPAHINRLPQGAGDRSGSALPEGAQQFRNDYGAQGWGGVCPPVGVRNHRYLFSVYALRVGKLNIPPGASAAYVGYVIQANAIGRSQFFALYGR